MNQIQSTGSATTEIQNERNSRSVHEIVTDPTLTAGQAAWECFRQYAQERPEVVALWAFGLGFILGWKLKIW